MANDCKGLEGMVLNERRPGEVEYLKKSLGPALVAGLAEICLQKPANPDNLSDAILPLYSNDILLTFLWLISQSNTLGIGFFEWGLTVKVAGMTVQTRSTQTTPDLQGTDLPISGNPFLIDIVIEMMAKKVDVNALKTLRKMESKWNQLALKELEIRALKNQLRALDLTKKWFQSEELARFLEATAGIPQLFHSFRIKFPNSIDPNFFLKYTPIYLHLRLDEKLEFTKYLQKLLIWMAPTVQELEIEGFFEDQDPSTLQEVIPLSLSSPDGLVFQKLNKLIWNLTDFDPVTGISRNSLAPFKSILEKSGRSNPTPNLTNLEVSTDIDFNQIIDLSPRASWWSQITSLRIGECSEDDQGRRCTRGLLSLGEDGMRLKMFAISLDFLSPLEESPEICQNLSEFLATQAKSLEVLEFNGHFGGEVAFDEMDPRRPKINLPIFASLQTLHLYLGYYPEGGPVHTSIFGRIRVPIQFPKLDHLHVSQEGFFNLFPLDGESIPLKSLTFRDHIREELIQACKFPPSVESLICEGHLFKALSDRGAELSWKESLKVLDIDGVTFPLKVSQLTSLRKLIVRESTFLGKFETYLAFFQQVHPLQLSSVTFKSREEPSDYAKAMYIDYFPFPVKFETMPFKDPNSQLLMRNHHPL